MRAAVDRVGENHGELCGLASGECHFRSVKHLKVCKNTAAITNNTEY